MFRILPLWQKKINKMQALPPSLKRSRRDRLEGSELSRRRTQRFCYGEFYFYF